MSDRPHIGLDNPVFAGRLRQPSGVTRPTTVVYRRDGIIDRTARPQAFIKPAISRETVQSASPTPINYQPEPVSNRVNPEPTYQEYIQQPATTQQAHANTASTTVDTQTSPIATVLATEQTDTNASKSKQKPRRHGVLSTSLVVMAGIIFAFGIGVSIQTMLVNRHASAQVATISKKVDAQGATTSDVAASGDTAPSTTQPTASSYSSYTVAPDLPRYITIPKIGVSARVLQVGVNADGSLGTPRNVFDTAWYTGSAKPGQPGATLIDGHVSSWTTNGVFYHLKNLATGDKITIEKGDGTKLNYTVVKTQIINADTVDMNALVNSVDKSKSGLNLITCSGRVKPGTSEFTDRAIVFATQD